MLAREIFNSKLEPLYLLDASAFIYKGYYAHKTMCRSDGFPTSAIYIVARILLRLLKEEKMRYFSFVLDGKGKNFRHELFSAYKANRSATPEDLVAQIEPITRLVKAFGLNVHVSENSEADDCIASLAKRYKNERPIIIVAIDKDLNQCLDENVILFDPSSKDTKITTKSSFEEKTGLKTTSWADIQALIGDSSDNIPGIKGIGEKTALQIFEKYSTLEEIRDNFDKLDEKIKLKLQDGLEAMFLYRKLTRLKDDLCNDITINDLEVKSLPLTNNIEDAITIFREYEMPSLERELVSLIKSSKISSNRTQETKIFANNASKQASLFDIQASPQPEQANISQINNLDITLTNNTIAIIPKVGAYHLYINASEYIYSGKSEQLIKLAEKAEKIIVPSFKDLIHIDNNFSKFEAKMFDLSVAAYLISPEERDYSFQKLSAYFASKSGLDFSRQGKIALELSKDLETQLKALQLDKLYYELELPLVSVLATMENNGIELDIAKLQDFLLEVQNDLEALTQKIYHLAGKEFNIRSAQQLGEILFKNLELSSKAKTKGGQISTSQDVLEKLQGSHPIIDTVLEFRKLEKLRSTYLEPLPRLVDPNKRIHTIFNQCATATGRLSSSNPNLQNIPIKGDYGTRMRSCFVASPGNMLISADYSQIELRVLAHLSQDKTLIDAFNNNEDIHSHTASLLFDLPDDEIDKDKRRIAKTINFGLIYGMGANKLANELKISHKEAKQFIDKYFEKLTGVKTFFDTILEDAHQNGFVTTITKRRRSLGQINALNMRDKATSERQAINTCVQGSAADIIKLAMLAVKNSPLLAPSKLLLQVHDELIIECPANLASEQAKILADLMTNVITLSVPLLVDYEISPSW